MQQIQKYSLNMINIAKIFGFLLILSLFFPIRMVFYDQNSYITGLYSDFTTKSLYISDILLFITSIFIIVPRGKEFLSGIKPIRYLILWVLMIFLWHIKDISGYSTWYLVKILEMFVAYGTARVLWTEQWDKTWIFYWFIGLSSLDGLLALYQFFSQKSLGLYKLGELILKPEEMGIAKILSGGEVIIRGYGTFPHPNLLGVFLGTALIVSLWLIVTDANNKFIKMYLAVSIPILSLGLLATFSRSSIIAASLGILFLLVHSLRQKIKIYNFKLLLISLLASIILSITIFHPYLTSRGFKNDTAVQQRIEYNSIGMAMIKDNPIIGLGFGQSLLHMNQYSSQKLWPWDIQPIHNYFLLSAAEGGVIFSLLLLIIFLQHIYLALKSKDSMIWIVGLLLLMYVLLMQTDHYFYTLVQAQLLLWLLLGIVPHETKNLTTT